MKKVWTGLALGTLVIACMAGFTRPAHAEDEQPRTEISISPTMSTIAISGGDTIAKGSELCPRDLEAGCAVEVKNTGNTPYNFRVHVTPYAIYGENNDIRFDEGAAGSYSQIARWITFLDDSGEYVGEYTSRLNPGEARTVYYRVDVPDDIPGGSQYAAIWAQTVADSGSSSVQTTGEAGMTLCGRSTSDTKRTGEISKYGFQRFSLGGTLAAHALVKNTGNTDYEIKYTYTARTVFGKELHSESGKIIAWPGSEYNVNLKWENDVPLLGVISVEFLVDAADSVKNERHIVVVMPVFIMILLISLLTVIVIWIIIIIRKRKERKARTLV